VGKSAERRGEVRCGEVKGGRRKEKRKLILKRKDRCQQKIIVMRC
jgi:hypothetical protein